MLLYSWLSMFMQFAVENEQSYSTLSPVSTEMGDHIWTGIPPWYVTKPTRSTQPCIPLKSLNQVQALIWRPVKKKSGIRSSSFRPIDSYSNTVGHRRIIAPRRAFRRTCAWHWLHQWLLVVHTARVLASQAEAIVRETWPQATKRRTSDETEELTIEEIYTK